MTLPEPVPHLTGACEPQAVLGTAVLTTAAMGGAGAAALARMVEDGAPGAAARLYDTAIAYQLGFRRAEALGLQDAALALAPLFRVRGNGGPAALRVLALMAPGDLMVNTPLDFITNFLDVRLDLLFLLPDQDLPAEIPDHDVLFVAVGEADAALLARLRRLLDVWPRPVVNHPAALPVLARDRLARRLAGLPGICSPPTATVDRAALARLSRGGEVGELLAGASYPVLLRPLGSHAGAGLKKIDGPAALAAELPFLTGAAFYLTAFADYRGADGAFRKYRVAFIDRAPHLCHMAVSQNWMVHYLNAGMTESEGKRAEEARAMAGFEVGFARRHEAAFARLHEALAFDYYSIDCGELPDGRLLVFEADTAAIIHLMDPVETFPYKHPQMRRVFDAFGAMLRRRAGLCASAAEAGKPASGVPRASPRAQTAP